MNVHTGYLHVWLLHNIKAALNPHNSKREAVMRQGIISFEMMVWLKWWCDWNCNKDPLITLCNTDNSGSLQMPISLLEENPDQLLFQSPKVFIELLAMYCIFFLWFVILTLVVRTLISIYLWKLKMTIFIKR